MTPLSKNISKKEHPHRDLSTALRSGRDDKGEGSAFPVEEWMNLQDSNRPFPDRAAHADAH
jgi:hypothetical protein